MYDFYINDILVNDILEFSYSENLEDVASSFSFTALHDYGITTQNKLNSLKVCEKGKKTPFYFGYITDCEHTAKIDEWQYTGFDVGFYLNKNEVIIQFKNSNISDAIKQLCREYQINPNIVPIFKNSVSKIYKDEVFADILKELLQLEASKGGLKDVYIDCKNGGLEIKEYKLEQNLSTMIANNILLDTNKTLNNISVKNSMQELKNRVIYTNNDEKSVKRVSKTSDTSVKIYGLLTQIETVDTKKSNNLAKLANDKLWELNRETSTITLSMLCDYRVQKGKIIYLDIPKYNLNGTYLIKSVSHTINDHKDYSTISINKRN